MLFNNKIILLIFSCFLFTSSLFAQTTRWRLIWDKNKEADMSHYEVYRSIGSEGASALHNRYPTISHTDPAHFLNDSTMFFVDDYNLAKGELIYYRLKAVDSTNLSSDFSEEVSACIPKIDLHDTLYVKPDSQYAFDLDTLVIDYDNPDDAFTWNVTNNFISFDENGHILSFNTPSDTGIIGIITIQVTDTSEFFDQKEVTVYSTTQNHAPIVDIPDYTILKGESFPAITLDDYVEDPDNSDDELTWSHSESENLQISINNSRSASIIITDTSWIGVENITFTATDPTGLSGSDIVTFAVGPIEVRSQNKIVAYPIPFQPSKSNVRNITFANLPIGGKLTIYDLSLYPVFKTDITMTEYPWRTVNQHDKWVRSGVYLYVVEDEKGKKVKSDKIIIIR